MMTLTLLAAAQAVADTMAGANPVLTPVASGEPQMNLWDMACKGGWIMIVLALMSVIAFYIFFERAVAIRKAGKDDPLFMDRIRDYIKSGEIKSAINYCRITNTPSARMIEKGITRMGRPVADVQAAIEIPETLKWPSWKMACLSWLPFKWGTDVGILGYGNRYGTCLLEYG